MSSSLVAETTSETLGMLTSHKLVIQQGSNLQYVEINKDEEGSSLTNSNDSKNYAQSKQAREAARKAQDDF